MFKGKIKLGGFTLNMFKKLIFILSICCSFIVCTIAKAADPTKVDPTTAKAVEKSCSVLAEQFKEMYVFDKDIAFSMLTSFLKNNPKIYGATFALQPLSENGVLIKSAPYVYRKDSELVKIDLAKSYDYLAQDWYSIPAKSKSPLWSKPYFDRGGGNAWMVTYSYPIFSDAEKKYLVGVITSDVVIEHKS